MATARARRGLHLLCAAVMLLLLCHAPEGALASPGNGPGAAALRLVATTAAQDVAARQGHLAVPDALPAGALEHRARSAAGSVADRSHDSVSVPVATPTTPLPRGRISITAELSAPAPEGPLAGGRSPPRG